MSDNEAIYIASISGGKCIQNTQNEKGECRLRKWDKTAAQQWTVEPSDGDANTVAFKSVLDGNYLASGQVDKVNGGKIVVQSERQWWTLDPGRGPEWYHVKSTSCVKGGKHGYLNDEWGRLKDDNKIQTYQYEPNNPGFNTFYFPAAALADMQVLHVASAGAEGQASRKEELDAREEELKSREAKQAESEKSNAQRAKELQDKEDALAKQEQEHAQKEKQTGDARAADEKDSVEKGKALQEREEALARREEELARKEQEGDKKNAASQKDGEDSARALKQREDALAKKEEEFVQREREANDSKAAGEKDSVEMNRALKEREDALTQREEELARKEKDGNEKESASKQESDESAKALKKREDALAKRDEELARKEEELATKQRDSLPRSIEEDESRSPSKANGVVSSAPSDGSSTKTAPDEDAHELCRVLRENDSLKLRLKVGELEQQLRERACQHQIKRPPRKIDRKVAGYVYK